ncbi:hypothetical protein GCM10027088_06390 [Nocardia goodfellowii]
MNIVVLGDRRAIRTEDPEPEVDLAGRADRLRQLQCVTVLGDLEPTRKPATVPGVRVVPSVRFMCGVGCCMAVSGVRIVFGRYSVRGVCR